ncbi:MAG: MGMT family protein [Candidatus Obscuribacterales bacterium]|nr:MGMT family protein [Candidatus Obscuribacterales bacterium]
MRKKSERSGAFEQVYEIVTRIPRGRVLTYGAISDRMNKRLSAAAVGWAMNALGNKRDGKYNSENVPWHRVINSKGMLSTSEETGMIGKNGRPLKLQQLLLEQEGIEFCDNENIDLERYLWIE